MLTPAKGQVAQNALDAHVPFRLSRGAALAVERGDVGAKVACGADLEAVRTPPELAAKEKRSDYRTADVKGGDDFGDRYETLQVGFGLFCGPPPALPDSRVAPFAPTGAGVVALPGADSGVGMRLKGSLADGAKSVQETLLSSVTAP